MDLLQAVVLGIVQGLTEFVPVSSSAHLVVVPWLLHWESPGLAFDTVLHLGTLLAVVAFFHRDVCALAQAWLSSLGRRSLADPDGRLAWLIVLGTIPAGVAGAALGDYFERAFSSPQLVGVFLIGTSVILVAAEQIGLNSQRKVTEMGWRGALGIGFAQAVAILPGISRSGSTIATGLAIGFRRAEAARFSFLLAIPVMMGAGASQLVSMARHPQPEAHLLYVLVGFVVAAVTGYLAIGLLLRYLRERTLYAFACYAGLLGAAVVVISSAR